MNLITYSDLVYENSTLQMEIEGLSDDALIDECNHIVLGLDSDELDTIMAEYFKNGELSPEQRKKAEALYRLAYSELVWEE